MRFGSFKFGLLVCASVLGLAACSGEDGIKSEARYPSGMDRTTTGGDIYGEKQSIFGDGGLGILGDDKEDDAGAGIGVNSHLWRASLETVSFMPLASADPFGGTILTDWYVSAQAPNERSKMNVFILDKHLRASAVKVKVFRQIRANGRWMDIEASAKTGTEIEDAILTRARQIRASSL